MSNDNGRYQWTGPVNWLEQGDERIEQFQQFKKQHGFTPDETWSLYYNICQFVLPRLQYFRKHTCGTPGCVGSYEEWLQILDKMIFSFQQVLRESQVCPQIYLKSHKDQHEAYLAYEKDIYTGFELFGKYFQCLWW